MSSPRSVSAALCAQDETNHATAVGTERHADADFARALPHGVDHHPVETDRRQGESYGRKDAQEHRLIQGLASEFDRMSSIVATLSTVACESIWRTTDRI